MKPLILVVTALSALVVVYFVSSVALRPAAIAENTSPPPPQASTQPAPEPAASKLVALLPDSPGSYNLQFSVKVGQKPISLPCRVFIPRDYDKNKEPRPLVVFLHGEESRGTDLAALTSVGPERRLREDQGFRDNFKAICISPQCPPNSTFDDPDMAAAMLALVREIGTSFRVDPDRITLTGSGMGAAGAWRVAAMDPDRFAVVAVNSAKTTPVETTATKLKHLYATISAPQNDKTAYDIYLRTADALGKAHAEMQLRLFGNDPVQCAQQFFQDGGTWDWINSHKRRTAQEKKDRDERDLRELTEALAAIPKVPGEYKLKFSTWVGDKKMEIPYLLFLPRGYDANTAPLPTICFLSGAGEMNPDLTGVAGSGPFGFMHGDAKIKDWMPCIVVGPIHDNSPERARGIIELMDFLQKTLHIDPDRTYCTGYSLGGTSTWTVATAGPEKFAAIAPMNARERCIDVAPTLLKYVTTWNIVGGADGDFFTGSVKMHNAMAAAGQDEHLTVIPNEGHSSWGRYFGDRRFYDWLFSHRRLNAAQRAERDRHPTTAPSQMLAHADQHPDVLKPGHHWLEFETQLGGKPFNLHYSLYLPAGYDTGNDRLPLMVYLHNDENRMTDQALIFEWGSGVDPRRDEKSRTTFPMIGLAPQLPENRQWNEPDVMHITAALIDEITKRLRIDADRIYLTGVQNGGTGTWAMANQFPNRFAAIFPFQSGAVTPEETAKKLTDVAVRTIAPQPDGNAVAAARQMTDALRKSRAEVRLDIIPDPQDPKVWTPYYTDPELVEWLLRHRRTRAQASSAGK